MIANDNAHITNNIDLSATEDSQDDSLSNDYHNTSLEGEFEDSVDFSLPLKVPEY